MKKILPILVAFVVFIAAIVGFFVLRKDEEEATAPIQESNIIEVSLAERPFVALTPDTAGHWLTLDVAQIQEATSLEYELLYHTASGAMQGNLGTAKTTGETSFTKKILLGSESSGVYRYDEGVSEGAVTIRMRGGVGLRKLETEFHLQQNPETASSIDGKFSITGDLPTGSTITMATIGLPGEIEGEVVAGPYGVFPSGRTAVRNGELEMVLDEEADNLVLYGWDGIEWVEYEAEIAGQTLTASVDVLTTYVVIVVEGAE